LRRNSKSEAKKGSDVGVFEIKVKLDGLVGLISGIFDNSGTIGRKSNSVDVGLDDVKSVSDGKIEVGIGIIGELLVGSTDSDVISALLISADIKEESARVGLSSSIADSGARRNGAFTSIRGRSSDGILLDKDLYVSASGANLNGKSGSIFDISGLKVISLVLDRVNDLGDGLSIFNVLNGGLVLVNSEGESRVGRVEDTEEIRSSTSGARSKSNSINDTPSLGSLNAALPFKAILSPDLNREISNKTIIERGEVDDKIVATRGELIRNVKGITVVSVLRSSGSNVIGDSEDLVGGIFAVSSSLLSGGSEGSVSLGQNVGRNSPASSSIDTDSNVIGSGLEGEIAVARKNVNNTAS